VSTEISESQVEARGLRFALLEAGPKDGPLALALHGFPDTPWTWQQLMPVLAGEGFRVVAPFMRGYAPSEVPSDGNYQPGALVADAVALHEALGGDERAVLIGHDWGAAAAYGAAAFAPHRWRRVVTLAVPPPRTIFANFFSYDQLHRSWYMFFFLTPLAEAAVAMDDLAFLERLWRDWSPGLDPAVVEEKMTHVRGALSAPANLSAALGYYRGQFDPSGHDPGLAGEQAALLETFDLPLLYIHGADDTCMGSELVDESMLEVAGEGSRLLIVDGAGHFAHLDRPDEINAAIRDFLLEK
jgi:pimeloyl-ACP methyl ester carboxylesterase